MEMGMVINLSDVAVDYDAAVELMDDELREELSDKMAPCSDQEFFNAYEIAHQYKFGSIWELSKLNPTY